MGFHDETGIVFEVSWKRKFLLKKISPFFILAFSLVSTIHAQGNKREWLKAGVFGETTNYEEVSDLAGSNARGIGIDVSLSPVKKLELRGAYIKNHVPKYDIGHGNKEAFDFKEISIGFLYKPVLYRNAEPFVGFGVTWFIAKEWRYIHEPKNLTGIYFQGGSYFTIVKFTGCSIKAQFFVKYNGVGKKLKFDFKPADLPYWIMPATGEYKISGLAFGLGILFCL